MVHVCHLIVATLWNPFIDIHQSKWNNVDEVYKDNNSKNEHWCINRFIARVYELAY